MAVSFGGEQYKAIQKKRIKSLQHAKKTVPVNAAKYMIAQLRLMCPKGKKAHPDYPRMYQTIRRNKTKVSIGGFNPNSQFPYVHWVNDTPGMGLTTWGKKYSQAKHQATPGFYWIAQSKTRNLFNKALLNAYHKTLSAQF